MKDIAVEQLCNCSQRWCSFNDRENQKDFYSKSSRQMPICKVAHCFFCTKKTLASKAFPEELKEFLAAFAKLVNFIKSRL